VPFVYPVCTRVISPDEKKGLNFLNPFCNMVGRERFERSTSGLTVQRCFATHTKTSLWCAAQSIVRTGLSPITLISYYDSYYSICNTIEVRKCTKRPVGGPQRDNYI